jgi:hypothetical protein
MSSSLISYSNGSSRRKSSSAFVAAMEDILAVYKRLEQQIGGELMTIIVSGGN